MSITTDETIRRYVQHLPENGPEGEGWYVLEDIDHGDGTQSFGYVVGGPYETEGEADDYKRHLDAGNPA